jgi:dTMP kinase
MGQFIVIDGTDGTGKQTQAKLLVERLVRNGSKAMYYTFPRYETVLGKVIRGFLNGDFGDTKTVSPKAQSLLFAADRFEASTEIRRYLTEGVTVICDRYVSANLGHQGAKIPASDIEARQAFIAWTLDIEYARLGLPIPDKTFILNVPVEISIDLLRDRAETEGRTLDSHESDIAHLHSAHAMFQMIAQSLPNTISIDCAPGGKKRNDLLSREQIHELLWKEI